MSDQGTNGRPLLEIPLRCSIANDGYTFEEVGKVGLHCVPLFSDTLPGCSGPLTSP